jgi:magnesium transporter
MEPLSAEKEAVVFRLLPRDEAAKVFAYLPIERQQELLKAMAHEDVVNILNDMSDDDRTELLEELPAKVTQQLLNSLSDEERRLASKFLGYPENSVGRLMTPHFVRIRPHWTVAQALDHIRRYGMDSETMSMVYVIDEKGKLIDDLRIRRILLAQPEALVSDLMDSRFVALKATDDQEVAVEAFREATEALEEPYMEIAIPSMVRKRATWLIVLFLSEMLTATAMGKFESEIAKAVVLSIFVPLVISSGGNSGSQASTLIIRAMALGEVTLKDWWRVMRREILSGFSLGAILGSIGFIRISLWSLLFHSYGEHCLLLAITVGLALVGIVLWGSLAGSMLPFLLRRIGLDPATSSAPFVATLVDVSGLIIYFSVAAIILRGTLL